MSEPRPRPRKPNPPGANVPEAQRHTVAVKLRLRPDVAANLRAAAALEGVSVSEWVSLAVEGV